MLLSLLILKTLGLSFNMKIVHQDLSKSFSPGFRWRKASPLFTHQTHQRWESWKRSLDCLIRMAQAHCWARGALGILCDIWRCIGLPSAAAHVAPYSQHWNCRNVIRSKQMHLWIWQLYNYSTFSTSRGAPADVFRCVYSLVFSASRQAWEEVRRLHWLHWVLCCRRRWKDLLRGSWDNVQFWEETERSID